MQTVLPRKVAISGSHSTGKTSLITQLHEHLLNEGISCEVISEVPRGICERLDDETFFHRGKNSLAKQLYMFIEQVSLESQPRECEIMISDRSLVDYLAYTMQLFGEEVRDNEVYDLLLELLRKHVVSYDAIYYLPIEFPLELDGVREADIEFQKDIDQRLRGLYELLGIEVKELTGTIEERAKTFLQHSSHSFS